MVCVCMCDTLERVVQPDSHTQQPTATPLAHAQEHSVKFTEITDKAISQRATARLRM